MTKDEIDFTTEKEEGIKQERERMKQEVHKIIREWEHELMYGTALKPYKDWARLQAFSDAIRLLEARLISKIKETK